MQILDAVDAASLRSDVPVFQPGDTVNVHVNITEGSRSRIQVFKGVVIGRQGDGVRETISWSTAPGVDEPTPESRAQEVIVVRESDERS